MQELFVREYLKDLKPQDAAIRAGYSEKSAKQQANQMLNLPEIKAAVEKALQARAKRLEITADMVLQELAKIGFAEISETISARDKISALTQVGRHLGMFTDKIDHTSGGQPFKALIGVDIDEI
jgi:phage terminase small subunit